MAAEHAASAASIPPNRAPWSSRNDRLVSSSSPATSPTAGRNSRVPSAPVSATAAAPNSADQNRYFSSNPGTQPYVSADSQTYSGGLLKYGAGGCGERVSQSPPARSWSVAKA
jgi:hypothetical protein